MNDEIENMFDPSLYIEIPGHESWEINCKGKIRNKLTKKYKKDPKINKLGYQYINIDCDIKPLHYFVLNSFCTCPDEDVYEVNHINSIRYDNCLSNLEWITHKDNVNTDHSIFMHKIHYNDASKKVTAINMTTNLSAEFPSLAVCSKKLKIGLTSIYLSNKFDIVKKNYKFVY